MRLLIFGPPGSGKGTQSKKISEFLGIPHISTGDIFRYHLSKNTELGKKVKKFLEKGDYVPDELVNSIVEERLRSPDCERGFILDGYPRTLNQLQALDDVMRKRKIKLDGVIYLHVSEKEIIRRLSARRICPSCGRIYNLVQNPPKNDELCDQCNVKLIQREDDKPEVIRNRLYKYETSTRPLIEIYRKRGLVLDINAEGGVEEVFERIIRMIGR